MNGPWIFENSTKCDGYAAQSMLNRFVADPLKAPLSAATIPRPMITVHSSAMKISKNLE
jgi:hypothetical protein